MKTIQSILDNCVTNIEIMVNIDGKPPRKFIKDKKVTYIVQPTPIGMRGGINNGLKAAKGKFIMKCDDHCLFAKGFDKILTNTMQENWLVTPKRYSLNEVKWERDETRPIKEYLYLSYPKKSVHGLAMFPVDWNKKSDRLIDDTMMIQGSCWLANRKYFMKRVGFLDDKPETYGTFAQEPVEVALKYWLGGGAVKVNKNTWYAHLKKSKRYYNETGWAEKFAKQNKAVAKGNEWATVHWMNNEEPNMIHPFSWFIKKFQPIPGWENYK
ncbi:MAG: hypothetical protein UV71_C0009G0010 [Microgenomates group bacterium GW2011_GWC1_43_13]|nr:MAG: hypothetical protein UV71_C0009G0010 [Microgenomates group bacterium GW2011_GWC1_43_13]KKT32917.1 MAG: hypothetical protein UW20_C0007G0009 [Candidatus Woesebacteria bacterium GW2011_GWB1_44_11]KKT54502.1 MAG: hypothetical protein UW47_C0005G0050 [Candidatus Woesebacteria bacterium GW2011_GWA1_44_23]